jgi:hypothetical protein
MENQELPKAMHSKNAHLFPKRYKTIKGVSQTIPEQTMSLRTLIDRFTRGLPITGNVSEPQYDEDDDLLKGVDLRKLDLTEIHELKEELSYQLQETQNKHAKSIKQAEKNALLAEIAAENKLSENQNNN